MFQLILSKKNSQTTCPTISCLNCLTTLFFSYKNLVYKNIEAQITLKFKNVIVISLVAISISFRGSNQNYKKFLQEKKTTTICKRDLFPLSFFMSMYLQPQYADIVYLRSSVSGNLRLRLRVKVMLIFGLRTVFGNLISAYLCIFVHFSL